MDTSSSSSSPSRNNISSNSIDLDKRLSPSAKAPLSTTTQPKGFQKNTSKSTTTRQSPHKDRTSDNFRGSGPRGNRRDTPIGSSGAFSPSSPSQRQGQETHQKNYIVKKRPPPRPAPQRPNDIYVSEHSNFKAQLAKCQKLLDQGPSGSSSSVGRLQPEKELFLHGLAGGIPRAINLALQLKERYQDTLDYSVNTSTIQLIDDLFPLDPSLPATTQTRKVSCATIRVFRTINLP